MKWIGQHIYDLVARYRSDVYLDDISTGTIASGGNLGLDSNNKIVKASASGGIAFDGSTANGVLTYKDADEATVESNLTYDGTDLTAISSSDGKPVLTLKTTHTTKTSSAELQFLKDAADTEDGENLGLITFYGENESNANTKFGHIKGSIQESSAGQEGGSIKLAVAAHDGEMKNGLVINDGNAEDEIDVTIGNTATSLTTIAGTLTMGSTAALNNSGEIVVVSQPNITHLANLVNVGTITSGEWRGTAISSTYLDADTAHLSTSKHFTYHMFKDDIDTTKHYIGLQEADAEGTSVNKNLPFAAGVAGKLLKVFLRATGDLSAKTLTWRLETLSTSSTTGTAPTVVGTQSGAGCTASSMTTYDFTDVELLDSGDNIIDAGDQVHLSIQSSGSTANLTYYVTCLWEWNLS